jgi:DNA-binding beta-propeller fold protein YncE
MLLVSTAWLWTALRAGPRPGSVSQAPLNPRVTATIDVGRYPQGIAVGEGSVWVATPSDGCSGEVLRIDLATNEIVARVAVDGWPSDVAVGLGSVWVEGEVCAQEGVRSALVRIDPGTNRAVATIPMGETTGDVAVGGGAVWVTVTEYGARSSGELVRVDPSSGNVAARIPITGDPRDVVLGEGAVWVMSRLPDQEANLCADEDPCGASPGSLSGIQVLQIDPSTNEVVRTYQNALSVAVGEGALWMSVWLTEGTSGLVRYDPQTGHPVGDPAPGDFRGFAGEHGTIGTLVTDDGGLWYWGLTTPTSARGVIHHIDASTMEIDASVAPDGIWIDAALDAATGTLWISNYEDTVTRIDLR